jgi:hypothetical protein
MANPLDELALQEIQRATGLKVKAAICLASDLRRAHQLFYPASDSPAVAPAPRDPAVSVTHTPVLGLPSVGGMPTHPSQAPVAPARPAGGLTGGGTGRAVPPADTRAHTAAEGPGAHTILRRATAPPPTPVRSEPPLSPAPLDAEAVSDELFEASVSTNPETLLRRAPEPGHRRRALAAIPIGEAEFQLFVAWTPRKP